MSAFEYEKESREIGCCAPVDAGSEKKDPEFPRVRIEIPQSAMRGLTIGDKISVTVTGTLAGISATDWCNEVTIRAEGGNIKTSGNDFAALVDEEEPEE